MNNIKVWPHLAIVALVCALVAGIAVAVWMKHEQRVSAEELPNAARIQRVDGEVALSNSLDPEAVNANSDQWIAATPNQPFSVGDRIYTRDNSRASLAFTGRNFARLDPNTSLDLVSFDDQRTQLALRDGSALFDVGYLAPGEVFEVATPYGAVDFNEPGLYNVGLGDSGAMVSVLSGLAQVVGLGGSGQISKGEVLTLVGQTAANVILSRLNGRDAGYLVDDYYNYQYPQYYDGRYSDYNTYLNDPDYFDPYQRNVSYQYVPSTIPGISDLDYYGDWQNVSGYGQCWRPHVDSGWSPYQQGYWTSDYPYGMTWVSNEPWGYAPYHYGRWANIGNQWYWIPDRVNTTPVYSPALVAFVPFNDANQIGWVPLAPGDPYVPTYYDANWQPNYLGKVVQPRVTNLDVPGAVVVVPVDQFGRGFDHRDARRADRHSLEHARPVLDPFTLAPIRNAVLDSDGRFRDRRRIDLPRGIAKRLRDTQVVSSNEPDAPRFRRDVARRLRVETVPERVKHQQLKVRDERRNERVRDAEQIQRTQKQEMRRDEARETRENRDPRWQRRIFEQEVKPKQREQRRVERPDFQQAQGARVANPGRREVRVLRQESPRPRFERQRPERQIQRQQMQRAVEQRAAPVRERQRPERQMQRQTMQRAVEQRAAPVHERQRPERQVQRQEMQRAVEQRAAPVREHRRPERQMQRAVEQRATPVQRQPEQNRVKVERKQPRPEAGSRSNEGDKGKGRRP